jgi:nicotinamide-nucleotide amidase
MGAGSVKAEILMVGTELLLGQIEDTNAAYMARALATSGIGLYWKTTVGDNAGRINEALRISLSRSQAILCSGGLGPTVDDITRDCVAEVMGMPLEYHDDLYQVIVERFRHRNRPLSENNKRQAMLPLGATPIANPHGTAPGLIAESDKGVVICMPGVPHELKPMLDGVVIPYLCWKFDIHHTIHYRVLKVYGLGESRVDDAIGDLIRDGVNPTVGLLASRDAVRVRIAAYAATKADAEVLIDPVYAQVRQRLEGLASGIDQE